MFHSRILIFIYLLMLCPNKKFRFHLACNPPKKIPFILGLSLGIGFSMCKCCYGHIWGLLKTGHPYTFFFL